VPQDPQLSVRAKPDPTVPRRVVDRLGEDAVLEMIEARRVGAKLRELVERYEVSESSLKRLIRAAADNLQRDDDEGRGRHPHR
jgi:phytoene/squalene synthetase